jgi:acyl-CoA thioesterase-1
MLTRFLLVLFLLITSNPLLQAAQPNHNPSTILVLGDSLSAGLGISQEMGWVALLQKKLYEQQYPYKVINASISGDTTLGGLQRLKHALTLNDPAIVIVELGGNDGLRGLPIAQIKHNLARIIESSQAYGARVLLIGMRLPPNYGITYTKRFHQLYADLASEYHVALVPFLLEGVATHPELMQEDGIHPKANAQPMLLDNVWVQLEKMLVKGNY